MPGRPPPLEISLPRMNPNQPRRLTATEAQARCEKGLCYYCDEKYIKGHRCKKPQFFLLIEETPEENREDKDKHETKTDGYKTTDDTQLLVSFNALVGCVTPNTIRIKGMVKGREVRILLNGGSTHNFVQTRTTRYLGLPITAAANFHVLIGNEAILQNEGCVRNLKVRIQGTEVTTNFYVLPLEGTEMVFRVAWMATLGLVTMDFSKLQFKFEQ